MFNPQRLLTATAFNLLVLMAASFSVIAQTSDQPKTISLNQTATKKDDESRPRIYILDNTRAANEAFSNVESTVDLKIDTATAELEKQAFELLNLRRKENGLEPLKWSSSLERVARMHSLNMARFRFFNHKGLDGLMVDGRADQFGISNWRAIGENIAYNQGFKSPVEFAYEGWMKSPPHRRNILAERWKETGIGIVVDASGTYYFTQVFLQR